MPIDNSDQQLTSQLKSIQEVLNAVTDMMPDRHFIVDQNGLILARFGNIHSDQFYDLKDNNPRSIAEITSPENTQKILLALSQSLSSQSIINMELSSELSDVKRLMPDVEGPNETQWFEMRIRPLKVLFEEKVAFIASIRNITERKLSEIKLKELVITDPLTQLYNRRYANNEMTRCLQRFLRYKTDVTVLMLDIDFFKAINDNHGHDVGDLVLIELSKFLQAHIRSVDTIARIGGEEFILIMPDVSLQNVKAVCERLIYNVSKLKIPYSGGEISVTVSGGLTQFTEPDSTIEAIFKRIDIALYRSKDEGRNRITVA